MFGVQVPSISQINLEMIYEISDSVRRFHHGQKSFIAQFKDEHCAGQTLPVAVSILIDRCSNPL